jgi:hypothetical protein
VGHYPEHPHRYGLNPRTKQLSYVAYNPDEAPRSCSVTKNGVKVAAFEVPGRTLLTYHPTR